jgi:hypothetical protein
MAMPMLKKEELPTLCSSFAGDAEYDFALPADKLLDY